MGFRKRREAILSNIGKVMVSFNSCQFVYAIVLIWNIVNVNKEIDFSKCLIAHACLEIFTYSYLAVMGLIFVISKVTTYTMFKLFPKVLIKWKRKGERKHRMVKD